ncbi:hypothetical protein ACHHYP_01249 [Achlya hypogyna]|uniref:Secreted protein n=1 Tax=Achlya hypogyna TaxID=1202772 RepID=A0A1V9Z922_ACHHY|nr:hypothetical protein ACHHYP_01249 [Achlya hypogyna]
MRAHHGLWCLSAWLCAVQRDDGATGDDDTRSDHLDPEADEFAVFTTSPITSTPGTASPPPTTMKASKSPPSPSSASPLAPSTTAADPGPTTPVVAPSPDTSGEKPSSSTNDTATKNLATSDSGGESSWTAAFVVGGVAFALLIVFVARKYRQSRDADADEADTPNAPLTFTTHTSDFQPMKRLRSMGSEEEPVPMMPPSRPSAFSKLNTEFIARPSLRNSAADTPPRSSQASSMDFELNAMPSPAYTDSRGNSTVDLWDEMPILISQKQSRMQSLDTTPQSFTL